MQVFNPLNFYSIYKESDKRCNALLEEQLQSAKQFNINVIPNPGVYSNIDEHLENENLYVNTSGGHKIKHNGVIGCFLSHYFLWKKCIELDQPIGVLEYDAYFIRPLPVDILDSFDDYCNLDYTRHLHYGKGKDEYLNNLDYTSPIVINKLKEKRKSSKFNLIKYINNNHIKGAFGYIIKPTGAKKLVTASKEYGILPADVQPNLYYCNVHYTSSSIVMLNKSTLNDRESHTQSDRTT